MTVDLVRGQLIGARRGVQAVVLPVADPALGDAAAGQAGEGALGAARGGGDLVGAGAGLVEFAVFLVGVVEAVVGAVAHPLRQDAGGGVRALVKPRPTTNISY